MGQKLPKEEKKSRIEKSRTTSIDESPGKSSSSYRQTKLEHKLAKFSQKYKQNKSDASTIHRANSVFVFPPSEDSPTNNKSNDVIRRNLLRKMSNAGVWTPEVTRKPSQAIIILDWDDTLLCTSYLNSRSDAMSIESKVVVNLLKAIENVVCELLRKSISYGSTYIVTNALEGWVEYSAETWAPKILEFLKDITVVSARSEYEHIMPDKYEQWKVEAFLNMSRSFDKQALTNLICIGDSNIEIEAARFLVKRFENCRIKSIKFRENPSPEELLKELQLVSRKFDKIVSSGKNLTISLEL